MLKEFPKEFVWIWGIVFTGLLLMVYTQRDEKVVPKCREYLAEVTTGPDSAAALSERPSRYLLREYAPTCRELLSRNR